MGGSIIYAWVYRGMAVALKRHERANSFNLVTSLFASISWNFWNGNEFGVLPPVTLIKIVNTSLDRSAALVLSVSNWMCWSCTGIHRIQLEIWPEPDLAGFPKNVGICRSWNPVQAYETTHTMNQSNSRTCTTNSSRSPAPVYPIFLHSLD